VGDIMAKKVTLKTDAQEAFMEFSTNPTFSGALWAWTHSLKGKIRKLSWLKNKKGVSEVLDITFPDGSGIRVTKFVRLDGKSNISIKTI
jgi:hypothetical protein